MLEGFTAIPLTSFGGKYSLDSNPLSVPLGKAINCRNIDFLSSRAFTRPGLVSRATVTGRVVGLTEYVLNDSTQRRMLAFDDQGTLYAEPGNYTFASVATNIAEASVQSTLRMVGVNAFNREYLAFGTKGIYGAAVPMFYDDTAVFRVAPDGPGSKAAVADGAAGNITAGVHQLRVFAQTASGYWTQLGPAQSWTAAGGKVASVTDIPTGPSNWVARVLAFTPTCSTDYYFIDGGAMVINDNTTTTATVDFTDTALIAGTAVSSTINVDEDLQSQIVLPAQAFVGTYNRRLIWTGERNVILKEGDLGFLNLNMDGGIQPSLPNVPGGWTQRVAGGTVTTKTGATGQVFKVTGDGINQRGVIENQGQANLVIPPGVKINCRVRCMKDASSTGTYHVWFRTTASGLTPSADSLSIDISTLSSTEWQIVDGQCLSAANNQLGSTHVMTLGSGDGATGSKFNNNGVIYVDYVEPYVAGESRNGALARWSKVDDPEAYDATTGFQIVGKDDGQDLVCGFKMGQSWYHVKTHSMYRTQDNGSTEPNQWTLTNVSEKVGTLSANGVALGDNWAIIAARQGCFFFDGSSFTNISYEINEDWKRINWAFGYMVHVLVDTGEKRITVYAPLDGNEIVTGALYCRYLGDTPLSGSPETDDKTIRDWSPWDSGALCSSFSERSNGSRVWLEGTSDNHIVERSATTYTDYGSSIISYYQTAFFTPPPAYATGPVSRGLYGYLVANLEGAGETQVDVLATDNTTVQSIPPVIIEQNPSNSDLEWPTQISAERLSYKFTAVDTGSWFSIQKVMPYVKPHPWTSVRGTKQ